MVSASLVPSFGTVCPPIFTIPSTPISSTSLAAADRPARRSASHPPCCTQMSTVSVTNWWPTTVTCLSHSPSTRVDSTDRRDNSTCSRFTDVVGAHQNLNGSRVLTTPLSKMVCYPSSSTCYYQPIYHIWILHSQRRSEKCQKWGHLG